MKDQNKGFTLIELLVVIAIIGILSSVVLVSLGGARAKARDARRVSDIKQIQNALELYFSTYGQYPRASEFKKGDDNLTATPPVRYLSPKFMPIMPTDPVSDGSYKYVGIKLSSDTGTVTRCVGYHLGAVLEEAASGAPILQTDADATVNANLCSDTPAQVDFDGADSGAVYDLTP